MRHRGCLEGANDADAGIVDERIDRAACLECRRYAFGVGHIQLHDAHALRSGQNIRARRAHGCDHIPAVGVEKAGGFEAVAGRAASDQDGFHDDFLGWF
ncbi:hypothetical protein D3C72_2057030 [compost metagenome]